MTAATSGHAAGFETRRVEKQDGVAVVGLGRPAIRNASKAQVQADLHAALAECQDRHDLGALVITGCRVAAEEAREIGLVTAVTPPDELLPAALDCARRIPDKGPLAVRLAKLVHRTGIDTDQRTGLAIERLAQALLCTTDDKREGAEAFPAKRPPTFTGR